MHRSLLVCLSLVCLASTPAGEPFPNLGQPLPRAHAHNDYEHGRPLLDALENGFCGVEADVHLVDGELLVAHDPEAVQSDRTLENLYLEPLWKIVRHNRGRVYPDGPSVLLLIDFKTAGEPTYRALEKVLDKYRAMLTYFEPDNIQTNAVTVVVSGNRPRALMLQKENRLAGYDARLSDLPASLSPSFAPLVSDNWQAHFTWRGDGELSSAERKKLDEIVRQVHAQGKKIRFWAVPDRESGWRSLSESEVDLINTDRLTELREFLRD